MIVLTIDPLPYGGIQGGLGRTHTSVRGVVLAHREERARMNRSRRRRASNMLGSTPRFWATCRLSSRTARTMSATRSTGTLPSRSAVRVAVIAADNCLLSLVMGASPADCKCGSRANGDRPLPKVVAGVVVRMGLRAPRWAHSCWSRWSPGVLWSGCQGTFSGGAVLAGRVICNRSWRDGSSG